MNHLTGSTLGIVLAAIGAVIMAVVILAAVATLAALVGSRFRWGWETCPSCDHPMDGHRDGECQHGDCGCRLDPWAGLSFSQREEGW